MTTSPAPGGAEVRRPLTTVFIDVVASTPLSIVMDDEDYNDLLAEYRRISLEVIDRHGGFVPKDEGDGRFVWFGWPTAHRDDAQRAVEMSAELLEVLGEASEQVEQAYGAGVDVRIGLHTGSAIVSSGEVPGADDVNGATVNFAAKVQGAADPGTVVITEATEQCLTGGMSLAAAGTLAIDPLPGHVELHRVLGPSTEPATTGPFVGRAGHLTQLFEAADVVHAGQASSIVLIGPAGIGKTRLSREFRQQRSWSRVLNIEGDERRTDVPFGALAAFMAKLGVDPDAVGSTADASRAVIDAIAATTEAGPVLVLVEDLQWLDPSSRDVLISLSAQRLPGLMLLMMTRRIPLEPGWAQVDILAVEPLDDRDAGELADVTAPGLTSDEAAKLIRRAAGNPFFLVWLARMSDDEDFAGVRRILRPRSGVPAVVQLAVRSQIDEAAVDDTITTTAATIGMEFELSLLARAVQRSAGDVAEALESLHQCDIVRPVGPGETYRFTHTLVRELAYDLLLGPAREASHVRVAEAIEELRPDDHVQLGFHYDVAGQRRRACEHKLAAAHECRRTNAFVEARALVERVLALVDETEGDDLEDVVYGAKELHARLGSAVSPNPYLDGTNATTGLLDGFDLSDSLERNQAARYVVGSVREWAAAQTSGNLGDSMQLLYQVRQIAKNAYPPIEPYNRNARALFAAQRGRWAHAEHLFSWSIRQMSQEGLDPWLAEHWGTTDDPIAVGAAWAAPTFFQRGRRGAALAALDQGWRRAEAVPGGGQSLAHVASHHAVYWELAGDGEKAIAFGEQVTAIATELDLLFWAENGKVHQRLGQAMLDPTDAALDAIEADAGLVAMVAPLIAARQYVQLAELASGVGDTDRTRRALDVISEMRERTGMRCYDAEEARLRAAVDGPDASSLIAAVAIARRQGATRFHLRALTDLVAIDPDAPLAQGTAAEEIRLAIDDFPEPDGDADVDRAVTAAAAIA